VVAMAIIWAGFCGIIAALGFLMAPWTTLETSPAQGERPVLSSRIVNPETSRGVVLVALAIGHLESRLVGSAGTSVEP
jgi:hypothetical protein